MQDVDDTTPFAPHVRGEIGGFGWHMIEHLPASRDESKILFVNQEGGRHKFFNVWPYVKKLRSWIAQQRKGHKAQQQQMRKSRMGSFVFDKVEIMKTLDKNLYLQSQ